MPAHNYYAKGDWNAICFECGFVFKASALIKHWQGYYVCASCWEPRHPQEFVRPVSVENAPPWIQPRPISGAAILGCTLEGMTPIVGMAVVGCCVVA